MKIYSIKEKPLPINRSILVYAYNVDEPNWYIDKYTRLGKTDHFQLNGRFYSHNISHWAELPNKPEL